MYHCTIGGAFKTLQKSDRLADRLEDSKINACKGKIEIFSMYAPDNLNHSSNDTSSTDTLVTSGSDVQSTGLRYYLVTNARLGQQRPGEFCVRAFWLWT